MIESAHSSSAYRYDHVLSCHRLGAATMHSVAVRTTTASLAPVHLQLHAWLCAWSDSTAYNCCICTVGLLKLVSAAIGLCSGLAVTRVELVNVVW